MNLLKRGVRFVSQDTDLPMLKEEVPLIIANLTPAGMERAALAGFHFFQTMGYSINQVFELLGDMPKEKS